MLALVAAAGGYAASAFMTSASDSATSTVVVTVPQVKSIVRTVTVNNTVTVREKGKVVRKLVPVVHRVTVTGPTVYVTKTAYASPERDGPGHGHQGGDGECKAEDGRHTPAHSGHGHSHDNRALMISA